MKLVREYIVNEKFTDESDPIQDMGIGLKYKFQEYNLASLISDYLIDLSDKEVDELKKSFNSQTDDIYQLGATAINASKKSYFDKINKIISHKNKNPKLMFNSKWLLKNKKKPTNDKSLIRFFDTYLGEIVTIEYLDPINVETIYFGDLEMAVNVDVLGNHIFEDL